MIPQFSTLQYLNDDHNQSCYRVFTIVSKAATPPFYRYQSHYRATAPSSRDVIIGLQSQVRFPTISVRLLTFHPINAYLSMPFFSRAASFYSSFTNDLHEAYVVPSLDLHCLCQAYCARFFWLLRRPWCCEISVVQLLCRH